MAMTSAFLTAFDDIMGPMWVEFAIVAVFAIGFGLLQANALVRSSAEKRRSRQKKVDTREMSYFDSQLKTTIEVDAAAGDFKKVLETWRAGKAEAPTPFTVLKLVVRAFDEVEPQAMVEEIIEHMETHLSVLSDGKSVVTILNSIARAGKIEILTDFWQAIQQRLHIVPTSDSYSVLLGAFASVGGEKRVAELSAELKSKGLEQTAHGYVLVIKGFLKNGMVDAVLQQITNMHRIGFATPSSTIADFIHLASEKGRAYEMFGSLTEAGVTLPAAAVMVLLEDCCSRNDLGFVRRIEQHMRDTNMPFLRGMFDVLMRVYASAGDLHALELFSEMQTYGIQICEPLCVGLLARCADAKFLRFAEEIVRFTRDMRCMSIPVYSALRKVYAYSGMYEKACDLYDRIGEDGLEPDAMMYGCLMRFAVECGRTELSRKLSEKVPSLEISNYMSLIRAARRDKDVGRAFSVLRKLQDAEVPLDIAVYNCVLDVCVSAGDLTRAAELVVEIRRVGPLDIITYNTLLKGYCATGDWYGAKKFLGEMEQVGVPPNDVSYNCLINAAVSSGNFRGAWETIDLMESNGVKSDRYTISIIMKAVEKMKNPNDVTRALALLDQTNLNVCSDEIMFNSVLEAWIRLRDFRRLEGLLMGYTNSDLRPSVHTYGSLIKGYSILKRLDMCWKFWKEMAVDRAMLPNNITFGCMLDALVCNGQVDDAVALFAEWKAQVPANSVILSTLIKGFALTRQPCRAMDTWREMREQGVMMSTVVYNGVIDAQARVGAMDEVAELINAMAIDKCAPDVITHSTVVKGHCIKGDIEKALKEFRGMQRNNLAEGIVTFNTVLDGCIRHNRMDLADQLLEDMDRYKIVPSSFTLGILVKMYGRRRQLGKAFEVVDVLARQAGLEPNVQVLSGLMCACLSNNNLDRAIQVFDGIKSSGQRADARTFGVLISGCLRSGYIQKAVALVEEAYGTAPGANCHGLPSDQELQIPNLEQLFREISNRGLMEQVGVPLLKKLRTVKAPDANSFASKMLDNLSSNSTARRWQIRG
jgi:pentatricopeptide repeat protein